MDFTIGAKQMPAKKLTIRDFLDFVPLGRQFGKHPWDTFDGIQTGKFNESQLGFYVSLKGKSKDYTVGVPPSVKNKFGKGEILTKKMKNPETGEKGIFVYSKSVRDYLS